ncbi:hypothetical protein XAB3213_3840009 [Xanthomonas citri pv. bilvae]|nr:hypothetical protein XAB3213_3840009 [Xanthomonas citri pv. bilvae]
MPSRDAAATCNTRSASERAVLIHVLSQRPPSGGRCLCGTANTQSGDWHTAGRRRHAQTFPRHIAPLACSHYNKKPALSPCRRSSAAFFVRVDAQQPGPRPGNHHSSV